MKKILIAFVGLDGSGKSTYAKFLRDFLGEKGIKCEIVEMGIYHKRAPFMISASKAYSKLAVEKNKRSIEEGGSVRAPGKVKDMFRFLDLRSRLRKAKSRVVITDRYFYDLLLYREPDWFSKLLVKLAPKPDAVFYLKAPLRKLRYRKPEFSMEFMEKQTKRLEKFADELHLITIDTGSSKTKAQEQIIKEISKIPGLFEKSD